MQWILHIGTQKTGTKSIQRFMTCNHSWLNKNNVIYPTNGRQGVWHQPIFYELNEGNTELLEAVKNEQLQSRATHGLISCEVFHLLAKENIKLMREVLGDCLIIFFIRRQDLLANSMLNQIVKSHRRSYSDIYLFEKNIEDFSPALDYYSTLRKWEGVFGFQSVRPVIYTKEVESIQEFCKAAELVDDLPNIDKFNPNPALNIDGIGILRVVKKLSRKRDLVKIVESAHLMLKEKFVDTYYGKEYMILDYEKRSETYDLYSESNRKLKERYFKNRDMLFPPLESINKVLWQPSIQQVKKTVKEIFKNAGVDIPSDEDINNSIE